MNNPGYSTSILGSLHPALHEGVYAFVSLPHASKVDFFDPIATFREVEGLTMVVEESIAVQANLKILFRAAWLTLEIQSDLAAVGLTAAVSAALASENIPCNVMAAAFHDHLFVPISEGERAMQVLRDLQEHAAHRA